MSGSDVLKSLLRSAARQASARLPTVNVAGSLRHAIDELVARRSTLDDAQLTAAVGALDSLSAATISCTPGRIRVDATDQSGRPLLGSLLPRGVKFAPRGAKELTFAVEPAEAASLLPMGDVVAVLGAEIAHLLWHPFLGSARAEGHGFVEREGSLISTDLRTAPAVRHALQRPLGRQLIEVVTLQTLRVDQGSLTLVAGFPDLLGR